MKQIGLSSLQKNMPPFERNFQEKIDPISYFFPQLGKMSRATNPLSRKFRDTRA